MQYRALSCGGERIGIIGMGVAVIGERAEQARREREEMRGTSSRHEKAIEIAVDALKSFGHVREIWLYGSYARGTYRYDSDVDILAVLDAELSARELAKIRTDCSIGDYRLPDADIHFSTFSPFDEEGAAMHGIQDQHCFMNNIKRDGKKIMALRFYDFAEDDYLYLQASINQGLVRNSMCSMSQKIVGRFLKQMVVNYVDETEDNASEFTSVLHTHNLLKITNFLSGNLPDFKLPESVRPINGYYFTTSYPGDESFMVSKEDVQICWKGVQDCKMYVDDYIASHPAKINEFRSK